MRRERILLVEDDQALQNALRLFFQEEYDVEQARSGRETLALLDGNLAIVVLDYRLPDCTGLELLARIKQSDPGLPVIMMTGCGSESLCASALKLGVRDYFSKPFSAPDLVSSVRRILSATSRAVERRENVLLDQGLGGPRPERAPLDFSIQKAVKLIQERYGEPVSLAGLAREVGMSKYHFSHKFRDVMGVSFREYLTRLRLDKAKDLLPAKLPLTEVAQAVGFGDLPRFDKLFKRYTGVSPSAYRP